MKKLLLLIITSCIYCFSVSAQTNFNNAGMENWTDLGNSDEEPTDWNSFMSASGGLSGFGAQQIRRTTVVRPGTSGTYSAVIWSRNAGFGVVANGNMTTGQVNMGNISAAHQDNHNITRTAAPEFSETISGFPDSIVFWVKFKPVNSASIARMRSVVHDNYDYRDPSASDVNAPNHVVGNATLNFGTTSNLWVRKSVPFTNTGPATSSTHILTTFTTNQTPGGGNVGDSVWIDDISLIYNPVLTTGTISPLVYYVSASTGATTSVPYTVTGTINAGNIFTAQLSNASGSFAAPVNIGTLSSTSSGTISATIPAGTATGTGYRIRTTGSNPALIGSTNVSNIQIILVSNSIAPTASQTIEAGVNGTAISVTETSGFSSREWKYATTSGGPYSSFGVAETNTSYTPNFATNGTYYVVCETTYPGGLVVRSNEVLINVLDNSVSPSGSQSLLVGVNGTMLTVTETPAGTAREWRFATISGGPYSSFGPAQTGMTYTPNFAAPGTYYVVCVSTISGIPVTSNEVIISVGTATLTTGTITGSPFEFSPNATDASVTVPYTVSTALGAGNIFTAQLSDASGSFGSPVNIGSVTATTSGNISATISHLTLDGTGYRIRVISSNPVMFGADNGTDLVIDQFDNSASPSTTQNIVYNTNGTAISATESQSSSRNWKYSTVSGGPYSVFSPSETSVSYTPNFALPGTYYVVCVSMNSFNDTVVSNETQINVLNGSTLSTSTVGSPVYYLSPNAVVTDNISFTSDIIFGAGNVFTAEISNASGSFASPTIIGTLNSTAITPVSVTIPNGLNDGTGYRIRITSSNPAAVGTDNGTNIQTVQFMNSLTPVDTQYVGVGLNGNTLSVSATHPTSITQEWMYKVGFTWNAFSPVQTGSTYTPNFPTTGTYPVASFSINQWNDTVESNTVMIYVVPGSGINGETDENISLIWNNEQLVVDLTNSDMMNPKMQILNMHGQVVVNKILAPQTISTENIIIPAGVYICRISDGTKVYSHKFIKP